jgi:hypothetical protein
MTCERCGKPANVLYSGKKLCGPCFAHTPPLVLAFPFDLIADTLTPVDRALLSDAQPLPHSLSDFHRQPKEPFRL